ncbi:MAG: S8 family serine peptidase [Candidatus Sumerlaeia bacterium]|nr:S8 family serine peptidase [Candidatus Sumerlaeia bacterium]
MRPFRAAAALLLAAIPALPSAQNGTAAYDVSLERETLIPKREIGADRFLSRFPEYDGRGVVVAVFDTGVDPGAPHLQTTTTDERKILDVIDASGAGDVDMTTTATLENGKLRGLTGRELAMPPGIAEPKGGFRVGIKRGEDLFDWSVRGRLNAERKRLWEQRHNELRTERFKRLEAARADRKRPDDDTPDDKLTPEQLEERLRDRHLAKLEDEWFASDTGPIFDCVLWNDGEHWRALVDTDEDGDLADEKVLRPFGVAGEYADFGDTSSATFAIQVYDGGDTLSIVTVSGSHGTHVAGIIAAHDPEDPKRNGVAPGAQIVSVRIGDIRLGGGSSNLTGEMRGVAVSAQYGVDIMNASWGGSSTYQDGSDLGCEVYTKLVRDYGVAAFVSAGNNGPALSTLGSPGGECPSVIGVGAYVSPEMTKALYSQLEETGDTPFNFSSRGPAKSGDLGVDIMAPGGAIAPVSLTTVQPVTLMNGTSMSSPSAAGAGALLLSAAKQEGIAVTPDRLRKALMNSAKFVEAVEVWAQGAGLVQVPEAFDYLKSVKDNIALDKFYDLSSNENELIAGPGLYRREPLPPGPFEASFSVNANFLTNTSNEVQRQFNEDIVLEATAPWVRVPKYLNVTGGSRSVRFEIDPPRNRDGSVHYAEIHGKLASAPEAGPLFRFPITIVDPIEVLPGERDREAPAALEVTPGRTLRRFYHVPEGANRIHVRLTRDQADTRERTLEVVAQSLASDRSFSSLNSERTVRIASGGVEELVLPVLPGRTAELAISQSFGSAGPTKLELTTHFSGVEADHGAVALGANDPHAVLRLRAPHRAQTVEVSAKVDDAVYVLYPKKSEMVPGGDRDVFPAVREGEQPTRVFTLRQTFEFNAPEKMTLRGHSVPDADGVTENLGGGLAFAIHESGNLVWRGGLSSRASMELPKGKTTIHRELRTMDEAALKRLEEEPLLLRSAAKTGAAMRVYPDGKAAAGGRAGSSVRLVPGRDADIYLAPPEKRAEARGEAAYYTGSVTVKSGDTTYLEIPLLYAPGVEKPRKRPEPDAKPKTKKKDELEKLREKLYDERLATLRLLRTKKDDAATTHSIVLAELRAEKPEDPRLDFEEAYRVAFDAGLLKTSAEKAKDEKKEDAKDGEGSKEGDGDESAEDAADGAAGAEGEEDAKDKDEEEQPAAEEKAPDTSRIDAVFALLDRVVERNEPSRVAEFFGAKPVAAPGDKDAEAEIGEEEKELRRQRDTIRDAHLLRAEILLTAKRNDEARKALLEALRWEADRTAPSDAHKAQEERLLEAEGKYATVLDRVAKKLADAPYDKKLLARRAELWRKLGWDDWAAAEEQRRKLLKASSGVRF